jgi:uracil-DNA glycosylase
MQNKIFILGEAFGEHEERERTCFVGYSGYELTKMLTEAGINRADCYLSNVFMLRPKGNDISTLCGSKPNGISGYPPLAKSKYVSASYVPELERLGEELVAVNANIIIALGNTAAWALLGRTGISAIRGTTQLSTHTVSGFKVLPTFHPAAVGRDWSLRPIVVVDLMKAKRESEYAELRRPKREIWIEPSIDDILDFQRRYINRSRILSVDIETAGTQITCIGFAGAIDIGIVIPFLDGRKKGRSYWPDAATETRAWGIIQEILEDPNIPKLFQNGLYDIAFLLRSMGIRVMGAAEDTMLLHHALQPEMKKGLGFLGSVYADEGAWKSMREVETIKRDD